MPKLHLHQVPLLLAVFLAGLFFNWLMVYLPNANSIHVTSTKPSLKVLPELATLEQVSQPAKKIVKAPELMPAQGIRQVHPQPVAKATPKKMALSQATSLKTISPRKIPPRAEKSGLAHIQKVRVQQEGKVVQLRFQLDQMAKRHAVSLLSSQNEVHVTFFNTKVGPFEGSVASGLVVKQNQEQEAGAVRPISTYQFQLAKAFTLFKSIQNDELVLSFHLKSPPSNPIA